MTRPLRFDKPGSWHHVTQRGIAKRPLFLSRADGRMFLAKLATQVRRGLLEVHAYSLLTTHFHLLVRSVTGQTSEALRVAELEYSRYFNRKYCRDGTLIRGRFHSKPVRSLRYRRNVVTYIDANAVAAGMVASPVDHELCSARDYSQPAGPPWLTRTWVESDVMEHTHSNSFSPMAYRAHFGTSRADELNEVLEFVELRSRSSSALEAPEDWIGSAPGTVRKWMQRKARLADGHKLDLPLFGPTAVRRAMNKNCCIEGQWSVHVGTKTHDGSVLASCGLLRDLCKTPWPQLASHPEVRSVFRARSMHEKHRELLQRSEPYASRVARIVHDAQRRVPDQKQQYGTASPS